MAKETRIQPGEVISVNLKDTNPLNLYSAKIKLVYSGRSPSDSSAITARPMNPNMKKIPLVGEIVLVYTAPTSDSEANSETIEYYYTDVVSIQSSVHHNAIPKLTKQQAADTNSSKKYTTASAGNPNISTNNNSDKLGDSFEERKNINPIQPFEGDIIWEGRWGQSIRFGSTITKGISNYSVEPLWKKGSGDAGDSIIIISNGRPQKSSGKINNFILEDINKDAASIYFTDGQAINLDLASSNFSSIKNKKIDSFLGNPKLSGKQIIINSDRIVINARDKEIILSSKAGIGLSSLESITVDTDKDFQINALGKIQLGIDAKEPIILGNKWKTFMTQLLDALMSLTVGTPNGPSSPPINNPQFLALKGQLTTLLSQAAYVKALPGIEVPEVPQNPPLTPTIPATPSVPSPPSAPDEEAFEQPEFAEDPDAEYVEEEQPDEEAVINSGTTNADSVRATLANLGYSEKGNELNSSGNDLTDGITRAINQVLHTIKTELPEVQVTVTGGNDRYHRNLPYASRHKAGNAVDLTVSPATDIILDKMVEILRRYAAGNDPNFRFIDEYRHLTSAGTGNHFHISWGSGTESQAELNRSIVLAQQGKITPITIV
jgi:hypothetical protein